ncbi:hypothetical protein FZI85_17625 [Mycobacterium sp. CBMA293]|uniref:hypothetical protein n=1 Tax=unclassified Mycolicibacterium TaxID=2636767 RepID=UPI0012DC38F4|nr:MULTISPECIES: hypothetical protein [unclassified Mycolicibacterium]MUL44540.1 hypothetical protein [Mycolicibacterium sp. CBMA 360]MUL59862.1 hypothetical protein [Mycolicibacterium sp. CBMA 335]MUL68705.1 hypothetical protein [Mycolicibacterium sp. CBMA 311]MUL93904.1 hypothetical protein [Mycolicibacterium sp. CBMA 230]MUM06150.1 hypothetical protein [Mycolicibacterium sp. CBMA 213]
MRGNILHAAVRTSVLSGATLLTAGAIAVAPLQPLSHLPSIPAISHATSTAAVNLTANAFDLYGQVFGTAATNLQADVKSYLDMGLFPILHQILTNQVGTMTGLVNALGDSGKAVVTALTTQVPGYLGAAFGDLGQANVEGALNNLQLAILLPVMAAINPIGPLPKALGNLIAQPLQSMINIANDLPNILLELGVGIIGPVAGTLGAVGTAVQNVINAVKAGDLGKLATAVIQAPATVLDGLLNGGYGPNLGALLGLNIPGFSIYGGGLLGGGATVPGGATIAGTLQGLVAVVKSILTDITPTKPAAAAAAAKAVSDAASVPSTTAATVTLSTAATTKPVATDTTSTDKVKDTSSTTAATGSTTDATTKASGSTSGTTPSATETSSDSKTTSSTTDNATKTGTSTGSGTDSKTTGTGTGTGTGSTSGGDTKAGSGSSSTGSSSSGSSNEGTKTTTPGRKGHQGKSGSDSGAGSTSGSGSGSTAGSTSGSSSASGSTSGSDSGAKGGSAKGSQSGSKGQSKSHSAA